jgi:hypothetical protein
MLFVSHFYPYEHVIQNGVSASNSWTTAERDAPPGSRRRPDLTAVFHRGVLPYARAKQARQEVFDEKFGSSNGDPPGPYRRANDRE